MDQATREDITAAAAVHSELGRDYDGAVAEGLIERIGAEIDKRVDARLGQRDQESAPRTSRDRTPALRTSQSPVTLALGSMGMGVLGTVAVLKGPAFSHGISAAQAVLVAVIWIVIGIINVVYNRHS